jgi:hypothetical protein
VCAFRYVLLGLFLQHRLEDETDQQYADRKKAAKTRNRRANNDAVASAEELRKQRDACMSVIAELLNICVRDAGAVLSKMFLSK